MGWLDIIESERIVLGVFEGQDGLWIPDLLCEYAGMLPKDDLYRLSNEFNATSTRHCSVLLLETQGRKNLIVPRFNLVDRY